MNISLSEIKTMSSREIAGLTDKRHDNVIQLIRKLEIDQILSPEFQETEYKGRMLPVAHLNKRDSLVLVARLDAEFTAIIVDRWQELESNQSPLIPQTLPEALRLAADLAEHKAELELKIAKDAPKIDYVDSFMASNTPYTFTKAAKSFQVARKKFIDLLRAESIIYRQSGDLLPSAQYEKHFEVKTGITNDHSWCQTRIKPSGMVWLNKRFKFGADVNELSDTPLLEVVK